MGKGDLTNEKYGACVSRTRRHLAVLRTCIYSDARETDIREGTERDEARPKQPGYLKGFRTRDPLVHIVVF